MINKYDAVVIGGGPAGSTAARLLAQADFKVMIVDRVNCIGSKVQCAEYVPKLIEQIAPVREIDISQEVIGIKTYIAGRLANTLSAPGYVLNRRLWDKNLWDSAIAAGAFPVLNTAVTEIEDKRVYLQSGLNRSYVDCELVVGCDGPASIASKTLGNPRMETSIALQYKMILAAPMKYVEIYFEPDFYGGYAWVFPKGKVANVGIGIHRNCKKNIAALLGNFCDYLVEQQVLRDLTVLDKTAGLIPAGGLADRLGNDSMLLAGDAAGCANPITGAGIMSAVVSGQKAAEIIIKCFRGTEKLSLAKYYQHVLKEHLGVTLRRAQQKRLRRDSVWTSDIEQFNQIIRQSWISFPEYYHI